MSERPPFRPTDLQGNIVRGNKRPFARYLILQVTDRAAARAFLATAAEGGNATIPAITREGEAPADGSEPDLCFNIGLTAAGLRALGLPADQLASFPREFTEGMHRRSIKIGDVGASAPSCWPVPFDDPDKVHIVASLCASDMPEIVAATKKFSPAFEVLGSRDGFGFPDRKIFFGYRDSIGQPRFVGIHGAHPAKAEKDRADSDYQPLDPLGTVLLGHPTRLDDLVFTVPSPAELGLDGAFNAFRILHQDTTAFEAYLTRAAEELAAAFPGPVAEHAAGVLTEADLARIRTAFGAPLGYVEALREVVAAQMCGRWRDSRGTSLARSPSSPVPEGLIKNFEYDIHRGCPVGAHIRRTHPRGSRVVQRTANYTRRLIRRGMSYAEEFHFENPRTDLDPVAQSDKERGLLGNFICASLGAQFEAVMYDWVNLGLQHPDITGSNDPLIGANDPETSWFDLALRNGGTYRLRGFPRFVTTRGGAYLFLPSLPGIRYLSRLSG